MTRDQPSDSQGGWQLDHSYSRLSDRFFAQTDPVPVSEPRLLVLNRTLAIDLGLDPDALQSDSGSAIFAGNLLPPGAQPIAQAYAGHQFGHFTMLGDGRAVLLGEQINPRGRRVDIQLKGSGQTPFSRRGDGRAALGPMLREYIISEAMHALGIPTTRSLAVALTGEAVYREAPLPGAVLTRVADSHIRVGTFEYAAALRDTTKLKELADYTILRHYPELAEQDNPYVKLLYAVMDRQASLVAQWLSVGFIHGVMNTDNMAISGETIDYGPCAFLDTYHPNTVFSSIDHEGRYAYGKQPQMAHWNLIRFAETLIPLLHESQEEAVVMAQAALETFPATFQRYRLELMRKKIGLLSPEKEDASLIQDLLNWMVALKADFTLTFYQLSHSEIPRAGWWQETASQEWLIKWEQRLSRQPEPIEKAIEVMRQYNPGIIPRNHTVEAALSAATLQGDLRPFFELLDAVTQPFSDAPEFESFKQAPVVPNPEFRTFCGT